MAWKEGDTVILCTHLCPFFAGASPLASGYYIYLEALGEHFDNASRARPPNTHPGHRPTQQRQLQEGVGNHSSNRTQPVPHHVGEYPDAQNRPKRLACFAVTGDVGGSKVRVTVLHSIDQLRRDDGELFQIEMPYQTDTAIAHTCGENAALK